MSKVSEKKSLNVYKQITSLDLLKLEIFDKNDGNWIVLVFALKFIFNSFILQKTNVNFSRKFRKISFL